MVVRQAGKVHFDGPFGPTSLLHSQKSRFSDSPGHGGSSPLSQHLGG